MKKPAKLNRTLRITKSEIDLYRSQLVLLNNNVIAKSIMNKIINMDLYDATDLLPSNFVDLMFIDPPYNLTKKFNSRLFKEMDLNEYEDWMDSWLRKIVRVLKKKSSIYICGDWRSSSSIFKIGSKYFQVRNRISWEREKGRGAKSNWKNCTEDIWFFTNSSEYTFNVDDVKQRRKVIAPYKDEERKPKGWRIEKSGNFRDTSPSNNWTDISIPFWSMPENTEHPTQKPEKLLAKIILASSDQGDVIFDPFLGSGTTAVVAKKLKRKFVGIEVDEYYACLAQKRIELAKSNNKIQGYEDGVFWERNTLMEQVKSQISKVKRK
jgi:site-specific DNA-methyltransferase (adenine-specific)